MVVDVPVPVVNVVVVAVLVVAVAVVEVVVVAVVVVAVVVVALLVVVVDDRLVRVVLLRLRVVLLRLRVVLVKFGGPKRSRLVAVLNDGNEAPYLGSPQAWNCSPSWSLRSAMKTPLLRPSQWLWMVLTLCSARGSRSGKLRSPP